MTIDAIIAKRFAVGTSKYNTIREAIILGLSNGSITERDVNKSPDTVINKLIAELFTVKGEVTTGTAIIKGITYQGDGKRYEEYDSSSNGGDGVDNSSELIMLFNSAINASENSLKYTIDTLRSNTDESFKNTINLGEHVSYHTIRGNVDYSNKVIATAFNTVLYTGTGVANTITSDVDMVTQHGATSNETCGGMIMIKSLETTDTNFINSTVLGNIKFQMNTDDGTQLTPLENTGIYGLESLSSTGFTLNNAGSRTNTIGKKYISYSFGTTHRKSATDDSVEMLTNFDFSNGITGWNNNGLLTMTVTNGVLYATDNNTTDGKIYRDITTVIGKLYTVKVDLLSITGGTAYIQVGNTSEVYDVTLNRTLKFGKNILTFKAVSTTTRIAVTLETVSTAMSVDMVSVKECNYPTNHDKYWECHYNPVSGFSNWIYEGSGKSNHVILSPMNRQLTWLNVKNLCKPSLAWQGAFYIESHKVGVGNRFYITNDFAVPEHNGGYYIGLSTDNFSFPDASGIFTDTNEEGSIFYSFGFANSYSDESGEVIGNFEIGMYSPELYKPVPLKENPGLIITKNLNNVADWVIMDKARSNFGEYIKFNKSTISTPAAMSVGDKMFLPYNSNDVTFGAYGHNYFYFVAYANENRNSTKSRYKRPSSTSVINVNDMLVTFPNGVNSRGSNLTTVNKTETVTNVTYTSGNNYLFLNKVGEYTVSKIAPKFLWSVDTISTSGYGVRDYEYDITKQKWYKVNNSDIGEKLKKDVLDYFSDGSCIATYRFDGATTELSGNYNASSTGIYYTNHAVIGKQSAYFNRNKNNVMSIYSNPIPFTNKNISISNWIYGEIVTANYLGFGRKANHVDFNGSSFLRIMGGIFSCGGYPSNYTYLNATKGKSGWNHYVTVVDMSALTLSVYVNGVNVDKWDLTSAHITYLNSYSSLLGLYEETSVGTGSDFLLDQIRIFNRAITPNEVVSLYHTDSYQYQEANVSFLDHNIKCDMNNKIIDVIELPKTQYVDKLSVNELEITKSFKPLAKKLYLEYLINDSSYNNRKLNTYYYNPTSEDMEVNVTVTGSVVDKGCTIHVNGLAVDRFDKESSNVTIFSLSATLPPYSNYMIIADVNDVVLQYVTEYRILKDEDK